MGSFSKILCTGPLDEYAAARLSPYGGIVIAGGTPEQLSPHLPDTVALVVRGDSVIGGDLIDAAPQLRVIGRTGVGYDNVDIAAATRRGIPVIYTPGVNARAVAEAAMTYMLALVKKLVFWDQRMKAGDWTSRWNTRAGDLDGATLGIIGFGSIGQTLAELVRPFQMTVLAHDPYASPERAAALGVTLMELDDMLPECDIITLHAPLTPETEGMLNRRRMARVKRGAYLINLARGGLIESLDVVYEALENSQLAGAALDVFEPEPPDFRHALFRHPRCLMSPHSIATSQVALTRIFQVMADDVATVLDGGMPRCVVNPEALAVRGAPGPAVLQ